MPECCCICAAEMTGTTLEEYYQCHECGLTTHWGCLKSWWMHGAGCPTCRCCHAADALRSLGFSDGSSDSSHHMPRTTSERMILLLLMLTSLTQRAEEGYNTRRPPIDLISRSASSSGLVRSYSRRDVASGVAEAATDG